MLIKEIEPINKVGVNLLKSDNEIDVIDQIIELPLRKACKIFRNKGIETVMSSANKNNVLKPGEKSIEKEDVYGNIEKLFETHTFLEAGKGYAWIMLNFDTLSDENKDLLFELEERKRKNGEKIGEKIIWFVHPTEMNGNIEFSLRIGKYDYDFLRTVLNEENIPKKVEVDKKLIEFEKRHIVLLYPWLDSSTEAVFLRMPINEKTTVEEVQEYFSKFAECFKAQKIEKKLEDIKER